MSKFWIIMALAATLVAGGCCCGNSGSREFIPGMGWTPTN